MELLLHKEETMRHYRWIWFSFLLCLWPFSATAVVQETFLIRYTQDLIELCSAPESDPLYAEAISFCHGYVLGAYHYQVALQADPKEKPLFCLPQPPPTRQQGLQMFMAWVKQNPQYLG